MSSRSPFVIALTGSIGSGKSAVAAILERLGATVIDADVLARQAVEKGTATLSAIVARFGKGVLHGNGELNREALGRIVFADAQARRELEQLVHPEVRRLFVDALSKAATEPVVYAVPLFFESGGRSRHPEVTKVVTVTAPDDVCLERVMKRDGTTREGALAKLQSQMPSLEKEKLSDVVITNDGTPEQLEARVREFYAWLAKEMHR